MLSKQPSLEKKKKKMRKTSEHINTRKKNKFDKYTEGKREKTESHVWLYVQGDA